MKESFNDIIRRSVRKDFAKANFKRNGRIPKPPRPKNIKRVKAISDWSEYYHLRRFILGRLVRIVEIAGPGGVWVEFVHEGDRENLNIAAGWSDAKHKYLLEGVVFDD